MTQPGLPPEGRLQPKQAIIGSVDKRAKNTGRLAKKTFGLEDVFLGMIIVCSLAAASVLAIQLKGPPVVVSTFLAVAVSTLVYRFLGGIPAQTTIVLKTAQITGSLAALVLLYLLFNSHLESWIVRENSSRLSPAFSTDELVGTWGQAYPEKRWRGEYTFSKTGKDTLRVEGSVKAVGVGTAVTLLKVIDGEARVGQDGVTLDLTLRGTDEGGFKGEILHWKTRAPITRQRATRGTMEVSKVDSTGKDRRDDPWDFGLAKME